MKRLLFVLLLGFLALPAFGQAGPGGGGQGGPGGAGGFGGPGGQQITPAMIQQFIAQAQQQRMANIKDQLNCTDDEFAALQPYIERVMQLQTDLQISRASGFRMGRQNIGALISGVVPPSDLQTATSELQTALNDQNSSPQVISVKLQALRDAKAKAQADLKAAQNTFRELLTQRQEGALVWLGLLD
jgi:multidrug resistance efflux pump